MAAGDELNILFRVGGEGFNEITQQTANLAKGVEGATVKVEDLKRSLRGIIDNKRELEEYLTLLTSLGNKHGGSISTQQGIDFLGRQENFDRGDRTRISNTLGLYDKADEVTKRWIAAMETQIARMNSGGSVSSSGVVLNQFGQTIGRDLPFSSGQVSSMRGAALGNISTSQAEAAARQEASIAEWLANMKIRYFREAQQEEDRELRASMTAQERAAKWTADMRIRYFREEQAERERIDRQAISEAESTARRVQSIVDRGNMAAAPNSTGRLNVQREIALRGITNPGQMAAVNASFDQQIAGQGGTGGSGRLLRGLAQTGIGTGMMDFRAYQLVNGLSNVSAGGGWGSFFGGAEGGGEGGAAAAGGGGFLAANSGAIAGAALGLGLLTAAQIAAANSASEHVRELRNLAEQLGTTTQGARQLEGAAKISGTSIDAIAAGMRQLTQGVEESYGRGGGASAILKSIGVSGTDSRGVTRDTKDIMMDISSAISGKGDLESRDILERLFGRGGRQLLPLMRNDLKGLTDEVNRLTGALDDKRALKYAEEMSKLGIIFDSLKQKFAEPLFITVDFFTGNTSKTDLAKMATQFMFGTPRSAGATGLSNIPWAAQLQRDRQSGIDSNLAAAKGLQDRDRATMDGTPEGIRKLISAKQKEYDNLTDISGRGLAEGDSAATMQSRIDNRNKAGKELEALKAELKSMEAKDPNKGYLAGLQRQVERADINEYDGFAKNTVAERDRTDEAKARNMPSAEYAKSISLIKQLHAEEDILTQKVIDRADATAKARIAVQGAQFDIAQNRSTSRATRALSRAGSPGDQRGNIADAYTTEVETASDTFDSNKAAIAEMQSRLDSSSMKEDERGPLARDIAERRRQNVTSLANATTNAASNALAAYTRLNLEAAAAQMKFNDAVEKGQHATMALASSLSSEQTIAGIQQTGGLAQIASSRTPGSAGRTANIQLSTSLAIIAEKNRALDAQHATAQANNIGDLQGIGGNILLNESQRADEQRRKVLEIQQEDLNYEKEKGRLQAEYQNAYYERAKTTLELEMEHLQAIRDMAGSVFDAATSGGRGGPVDALSKLGISTGKSIGRTVFGNIAAATVGKVIGTGTLEFPGQVEKNADGTVKKDAHGNDQLTALGKILQGTPFGHHQKSAVEQTLPSIDKNADLMRQDLDEMLNIMRAGVPQLPGGSVSALPGVSLPGFGGWAGGGNGFLSAANSLGGLVHFGGAGSSGGGGAMASLSDVLGSGMIFQNNGSGGGTPTSGTSGVGATGGGGLSSKLALPGGVNGANIALAGTGILTALGGIQQGGGKGIATAIGGGLETAGAAFAMFDGPAGMVIGGAMAAVGAATSAIAQLFGSTKQDRIDTLDRYATNNRWTAPAAYNLVTGTDGRSVTPDIFGAPRSYNGSLLAYPNTSSYNSAYDYTFNKNYGSPVPGGQATLPSTQLPIVAHIQINAMDAGSMLDRKHDIASAVTMALAEGHAGLTAEVQNVANKL